MSKPLAGTEFCWACPLCGEPLSPQTGALRCAAGHSYDRAREGYVNLLLANHKRSTQPGDDAGMVSARRAFLAAGHYHFLAKALCDALAGALAPMLAASSPSVQVLDMGCGEGYYLNRLAETAALSTCQFWGVDISKAAIKSAARLNPKANIAVASNHRLPLPDSSVQAAFAIFAPFAAGELKRVLANNAVFLRVSPGARHLMQIKQALFKQPEAHRAPSHLAGAEVDLCQNLHKTLVLTKEDLRHLLAMTPLAWRGNTDAREALLARDSVEVEADFVLELMRFRDTGSDLAKADEAKADGSESDEVGEPHKR